MTEGAAAALHERGDAAAQAGEALDLALQGDPRVVVIRGCAGTGKSTVMGRVIAQARDKGARVIVACGSYSERQERLGILTQLVTGPHSQDADLRAIATIVAELVESTVERSELVRRACGALLRLAAAEPLVICVDDVHHADGESVDVLLRLSRRLALSRVLLVMTEADQPAAPRSRLSLQLARSPFGEYIRLRPLDEDAVGRVLGDRLGSVAGIALASEALSITGGCPALVVALAKDTAEHSAPDHDASVALIPGEAFALAYTNAAHAGGDVALRLTRTLALMPLDSDHMTLARVSGLSPAVLSSALRDLTRSGLLDAQGLQHPAARQAVLDDLSPSERTVMHAEIAGHLFAAGAATRVVAEHLMQADRVDEPWASEVLADTAEQSVLEGERPGSKMRELMHLDRERLTARDRARVSASLVNVEWRVNPLAAVRRLPELTAAVLGGHLTDHRALDVYQGLLWSGKTRDAEAVLRSARASLDLENARNRTALAASHEMTSIVFPGLVRRLGPLFSFVSSQASEPQGAFSPTKTAFERLLRNLRAGTVSLTALSVPLAQLVTSEHSNDAELSLGPAAAQDSALIHAFVSLLHAESSVRGGHLAAGHVHAEAALARMPVEAWGIVIAAPLSTMLTINTELGQFADAQRLLDARMPSTVFKSVFGLRLLLARGRFLLARGDFDAALAEFSMCGQIASDWGLVSSTALDWRLGAAEALLSLGATARARDLLNEELAERPSGPTRRHGAALRLLAAASRPREREGLLQEAVAVLHASGDRVEVVRAYRDQSAHYQALGSRPKSLAAAHAANALLRHWHQRPVASADAVPRSDGADERADVATLTNAERRVGSLAAVGLRNQEIARRLSITVSTVEQHLTNVYRKLDLKGRSQLQRSFAWDLQEPATHSGGGHPAQSAASL